MALKLAKLKKMSEQRIKVMIRKKFMQISRLRRIVQDAHDFNIPLTDDQFSLIYKRIRYYELECNKLVTVWNVRFNDKFYGGYPDKLFNYENVYDVIADNSIQHSDQSYVQDIEGMVCFLARCYMTLKHIYFDTHMETCSVDNPNRRALTEAEQLEWQKFPLIQGSKLQDIVRQFAESVIPMPKDISNTITKFKNIR